MHTTEQNQQQQQHNSTRYAHNDDENDGTPPPLFRALARAAPLSPTSCLRASFVDSLEVVAKELAKEKGFAFDPIRSNYN